MFTSCRITEYCYKCGLSHVLVQFRDKIRRTDYICGNCKHINPITLKNQKYIRDYKYQNPK